MRGNGFLNRLYSCFILIIVSAGALPFIQSNLQLVKEHRHWDAGMCANAAQGGNLQLLDFLLQEGFATSPLVCDMAAQYGHLNLLHWARETKGLPWGSTSAHAAARGGHLEILQWLVTHECPYDFQVLVEGAQLARRDIILYGR